MTVSLTSGLLQESVWLIKRPMPPKRHPVSLAFAGVLSLFSAFRDATCLHLFFFFSLSI